MTEARQSEKHKGANAGLEDGGTPNTVGAKGGKRPTEAEDAFGGAERVRKGKPVNSDKAKP